MKYTVKDFAKLCGVSETMIYRHIRNLKTAKPELADRIQKESGVIYFDEVIAHEIENHLTKTAIAVTDIETQSELDSAKAKIEELQSKYTNLLEQLTQTQSSLLESQDKLLLLSKTESQQKLLESNLELEKQHSKELQKQLSDFEKNQVHLEQELQREMQRPLTLRERITGHKRSKL